jgi:hypothetical protein
MVIDTERLEDSYVKDIKSVIDEVLTMLKVRVNDLAISEDGRRYFNCFVGKLEK